MIFSLRAKKVAQEWNNAVKEPYSKKPRGKTWSFTPIWIRAFVKIYSCTGCTKKTICKNLEFKIYAKQGV